VVVLTRLARSEKLTPIETMKLAAGEVAGEKSIKTLAEVIDTLNQDPDITKRFGQKGLGQRNLGRPPAAQRKLGNQRGPVHVRL
jgi:serine protein kinase